MIGAALIFWLWSFGLERTTPTRVAITVTLNPITAMAPGALVLHEPFTPHLLLGFACIVIGIALANWRKGADLIARERAR